MAPSHDPTPWTLLAVGLLLGLRHAADPDHLAAVSAIAARSRGWWPSARLGVAWGLGHAAMLFVVGGGIILFGWVIPPRLGLGMELGVAVALIALGLANVRGHRHHHDASGRVRGPRQAFAVGLVHGLAGSAAAALLVLSAVQDPRWACAYLVVFGAGTVAGMALITTGLAWPFAAVADRFPLGRRLVPVLSGAAALGVGIWLAGDIATSGLLAGGPSWTHASATNGVAGQRPPPRPTVAP